MCKFCKECIDVIKCCVCNEVYDICEKFLSQSKNQCNNCKGNICRDCITNYINCNICNSEQLLCNNCCSELPNCFTCGEFNFVCDKCYYTGHNSLKHCQSKL